MITLALDTASPRGAVALLHGDELIAEQTFDRHDGENLFAALARLGPQTRDAQLIAVGLGPGSFTGIRAGIAAAKGLALPGNIPIRGVSSFDALALTALPRLPAGAARLGVLADARRGEVYCAFYDRTGARLGNIEIRTLAAVNEPAWFVSWEIERYREAVGGGELLYPSAAAVGRLAQRGGERRLEPLYLRTVEYRTVTSTNATGAPRL